MEKPVTYLDYSATTPVDPRVLEKMIPFFQDKFGNPSSVHMHGQIAEAAVEQARREIAATLNCEPDEVIFTACGTESDNLALRGAALASRAAMSKNHLLISPVEHQAISQTAAQLADLFGFEVEFLPVNRYGQVAPDDVAGRIRDDTCLVSIIYANNEVGTINPIAEIGEICRVKGVTFHSDAVQAGAHLSLDTKALRVDLLSLGAHKFYGPKGIGALFARRGTPLTPMLTGGGQEHGLRAGTLNVAFIVGMAAALSQTQAECEGQSPRFTALRNRIVDGVLGTVPDARLTGHPSRRLPNHTSFVFKNVDGNALLAHLDVAGFACSSGSACKTGSPKPSDVLTALGIPAEWALGSLRVTLGAPTTEDDIERFLAILPESVSHLRELSLA
jgi:cysteine desulfurase